MGILRRYSQVLVVPLLTMILRNMINSERSSIHCTRLVQGMAGSRCSGPTTQRSEAALGLPRWTTTTIFTHNRYAGRQQLSHCTGSVVKSEGFVTVGAFITAQPCECAFVSMALAPVRDAMPVD